MTAPLPNRAAGDRLERLLDEELCDVTQAAPVDLRAKVLERIHEVPGARFRVPVLTPLRLGLAAAAMLLLAVVLVPWRSGTGPTPGQPGADAAPLASAQQMPDVVLHPAAAPPSTTAVVLRSPRGPRRLVWDQEPAPVEASIASSEPYLPGAPAGELGDPLQAMPTPPPISFAPINPAAPVSELARPVTDFPADNSLPVEPSGATGTSGGTRR